MTTMTKREGSALRLLPALATLSAFVGLAGCAQIPGAPPVVVQCATPTAADRSGPALVGQPYGMQMTALPLNSVQFGSNALATTLAVQNLYASRTPTDTVLVSARFVSCIDRPTSVRVRTSFVRADSAPSEAPTAWKTVFVEPRATALYTELSSTRDASAYLIEVAP